MDEQPKPTPAPARRRHWSIRLATAIGLALGGLVLLAALLLAGGWEALRTETGTGWLLSQVKGLRITDGHGSLRGGPFRAARLEFDLEGSPVHVRIDNLAWRDLAWKWRPYPGAWTGLTLEGLQAQRVEIRTRPTQGPKQPPPEQVRLPVELHVIGAQVQQLQVDTIPAFRDVALTAHLGMDRGTQHQVEQLRFRWDRLQVQANATLGTDKPMPLKLQASAQSLPTPGAEGLWATPWAASVNAEGPLAALAVAAQLRAAAPATMALDVKAGVKPFEAWPLSTLQAEARDLDLARLAEGLPATRLSGHADIETRGLDQPAHVVLRLANALAGRWDEQKLPVAALQLDARARPDAPAQQVELHAFDLQLGSAAAPAGRWQGSGRWEKDHLRIDTRIDGLQPARLDARAPALQLSGPLQGTLQLRPEGKGFEAAVDAKLDGSLAGVPGRRITLAAAATADQQPDALTVVLKQLEAGAGGARAQGEATLRQPKGGDWQVSSRGTLQQFDPALWFPGPEGSTWRRGGHRLNGHWDADLVMAPMRPDAWPWPGWRGKAAVSLVDSTLAGVPLKADARWTGAERAGTLQLDLLAGGAHGGVDGARGAHLVLDGARGAGGDDRWRADLDAPSLAPLAPLMALAPAALAPQLPTAGKLTLHASGAGSPGRFTQWRWDGDLQAADLKSPAWRLGRAQARWRFAPAPDAPLELTLNAEALALGAQTVDRIQAQASGSTASHRLQLQADSAARPPAWADLFVPAGSKPGSLLRVQGQGGWRADAKGGRWQGALERLRAGPPGAEGAWLQADQLRAAIDFDAAGALKGIAADPGRLQLMGAALRWTELRWLAGGDAALPRLDLQAELEPLRVAPLLAALQPDFGWGGDLVIRGKAQLHTRDAFSADVVLERAGGDLTVTDEGGTQRLGLTDLRLGWVAQQGTWHFSQAVAGATLGVLGGAQSLRLSPRAIWPAPDTPMEGVLELRVDNLGTWGGWVPPGWRLSGGLHVSASVGGRFKAPEYTGRLEARGLGVRNLLLGVNARDGDVRVALKGPTAQIERFVVKGGDGDLQLQGGATFGAAPRAQIQLQARRFQVLGRVDRRIVASGNAEMKLEADAVQLDGKFHVDEGLVDFSRADAPSLDEDVTVVRRVNGHRVTTSAENPPPEPKPAEGPAHTPREVRAALDVDLGEQLHIRGHGLDAYLRGQLHVSTPGNRLAVTGTVRTENGNYAAYGQKLDIERGQVTFLGPVENPRLDIVALRPNMDIRVGVLIGGTALKPRVRLFSEPDMSDSDKLSWLVLGRAPEGLGRADTALLQRAAMALLAGEEGGGGDKVLKTFGIDDFSVRQEGEGDLRNTVVALGKQVSRRWYVGYERGLNSTVGTWQAIYRIAQRFTLRGQAGEDNAVDLIWTWRWN